MKGFTVVLLVVVLLFSGCQLLPTEEVQAEADLVTITLLNTADEHGWLQPFSPFGSDKTIGGAANVHGWWTAGEAVNPETVLVLSSGDNWTGPSISTWYEGEPMVEVFNLMGYHASAIGNHEFDFGREVMDQRFAEADYAYLAANIRDRATGELASFSKAYELFELGDVTVGVIGLITTDTATTTHPKNIGDLSFAAYDETLNEFLPDVIDAGAEVVVVLAHVCVDELAELASEFAGRIHALFAGHCNEFEAQMVDGASIMGSGAKFAGYAKLDITYDRQADEVVEMEQKLVTVEYMTDGENPVTPNAEIVAVVEQWQELVDAQLNEVLGYTAEGIEQRSHSMANLVTDAWLWAHPSANIALTNWGGFRAEIPAGDITWGTIVDVLPFDNNLVTVKITGEQLAENLLCCGGAVGGISYAVENDGVDIKLTDGSELDPEATYIVMINDFMYAGGDDYLFGEQDHQGYDTNVHWRQPVIDYLLSLDTDVSTPLDTLLDPTARVQ